MPDGRIEIMRPGANEAGRFLYVDSIDRAIGMLRFLLKREAWRVKRERFVPELDIECKKLLRRTIQERKRQSHAT